MLAIGIILLAALCFSSEGELIDGAPCLSLASNATCNDEGEFGDAIILAFGCNCVQGNDTNYYQLACGADTTNLNVFSTSDCSGTPSSTQSLPFQELTSEAAQAGACADIPNMRALQYACKLNLSDTDDDDDDQEANSNEDVDCYNEMEGTCGPMIGNPIASGCLCSRNSSGMFNEIKCNDTGVFLNVYGAGSFCQSTPLSTTFLGSDRYGCYNTSGGNRIVWQCSSNNNTSNNDDGSDTSDNGDGSDNDQSADDTSDDGDGSDNDDASDTSDNGDGSHNDQSADDGSDSSTSSFQVNPGQDCIARNSRDCKFSGDDIVVAGCGCFFDTDTNSSYELTCGDSEGHSFVQYTNNPDCSDTGVNGDIRNWRVGSAASGCIALGSSIRFAWTCNATQAMVEQVETDFEGRFVDEDEEDELVEGASCFLGSRTVCGSEIDDEDEEYTCACTPSPNANEWLNIRCSGTRGSDGVALEVYSSNTCSGNPKSSTTIGRGELGCGRWDEYSINWVCDFSSSRNYSQVTTASPVDVGSNQAPLAEPFEGCLDLHQSSSCSGGSFGRSCGCLRGSTFGLNYSAIVHCNGGRSAMRFYESGDCSGSYTERFLPDDQCASPMFEDTSFPIHFKADCSSAASGVVASLVVTVMALIVSIKM